MSKRALHEQAHPLAGRVVTVKTGEYAGKEFRVEDYWDRVSGGSWMDAVGNPAALIYAMRSATQGLPLDNEVVYGKIGASGHLVHISELGGTLTCACGLSWTRLEFDNILPPPKRGALQSDGEGGWLVLRQCRCGSTLAQPLADGRSEMQRLRDAYEDRTGADEDAVDMREVMRDVRKGY